MKGKRKRHEAGLDSKAEQGISENTGIAETSKDGGGSTTTSTRSDTAVAPNESKDDDDDIKAEIKRRREQLAKEEHDLKVSLCKARVERAVLTQARTIIDSRIRDLQKQV